MEGKLIRSELTLELLMSIKHSFCRSAYHTVYSKDMGCSLYAGCIEFEEGFPPERKIILLNGSFFSPKEAIAHADSVRMKIRQCDDFDLAIVLLDSQS